MTTLAQENYNSESYKVVLGDIESTTFAKDSTANALVIYEQGKSHVDNNDYDLRTEAKFKIKILNSEGFDNANVEIHLYNNKSKSEKIKDIIATTYNKNGNEVTTTKLEEKNIFREKYDENHTLVKFTLPNIKEGSVITYSYKIISPFVSSYKGWEFQGDIPKLYSEYNASIPGNWLFHTRLVGGKKLTTNTSVIKKECLQMRNGASADCSESVYAMKNVPAFIEEDYMTTKRNYLARIEYDLETFRDTDGTVINYTKSWKDVDREFRTDKEIGKQLKKTIKTEDLLSSAIINDADQLNKAESIYNYVQDNYTWNGDYKIYRNVSVKDLLKNKSGNVSSINILLHNLLRESGIDVKPVLLSTRNNGFPTTIFPAIFEYNYLIVQATINDKQYLLDATDSYLNFGDLPYRCLNQIGRLLDFKNGSAWIDINPRTHSNVFYQTNLKFDENDLLVGSIKTKRTGYHALYKKKEYYSNEDEYINTLENKFPYIDISNFEVTSDGVESKDFKESYAIEYNFDDVGDNVYLNPFFVTFFKENPFKLQERSYPIDFGYSDSYFYMFNIELNDHYSIVEIPKEQKIALPNNTGQLVFSSKQIGNSINFLLKIDFKTPIYDVDYYPYLKAFMSKIVEIQNNTVILLKKTI
ncbi:DUF3857 domain-containing protein [Algibacter amylolyticus]|nr:DUF3857 domain-containing protein [Algibacter amylolyticus]MBB5269099.1 hypothetical protein [Algibacter amylolyticus]